jgi:hypothetical protein
MHHSIATVVMVMVDVGVVFSLGEVGVVSSVSCDVLQSIL